MHWIRREYLLRCVAYMRDELHVLFICNSLILKTWALITKHSYMKCTLLDEKLILNECFQLSFSISYVVGSRFCDSGSNGLCHVWPYRLLRTRLHGPECFVVYQKEALGLFVWWLRPTLIVSSACQALISWYRLHTCPHLLINTTLFVMS